MRISDWSSDVCSSDLPSRSRAAPDLEGAEDLRDGADDDVVFERRVALHVTLAVAVNAGRGAAEGDALVEGNVVADLRGRAEHHAHAVVDEEAAPEGDRQSGWEGKRVAVSVDLGDRRSLNKK